MLFSGIPFLFYFLPTVLLIYFAAPRQWKNAVLLFGSLLFYAWGEPKYVFLMIATILLFYLCGLAIGKSQSKGGKKVWLAVSVVLSLASLAVFKYADFFLDSFNRVTGLSLPLLKLALPIGISFYTFQCLSYTVDVYRGDVPPQKNIISFGAYVALFPQLIAGPIVRYVDISRQLENRGHTWDDFATGLGRFMIGLSKKVILANSFGELTEIFRGSTEQTVLFYWLYAVGFALHIYFDFSGYSDMAIGLGRIFGFRFLENFNYPFISRSVSEFWRRWHISLGSWFRDYVYIPLGGNRVSGWRWVFNIFVVWMLTGLWHGAAWNFVLWGLLYGVLLLLEKVIPWFMKIPNPIRRGYVILVTLIGFVLFNSADLSQAISDIGGMFAFGRLPLLGAESLYYLRSYGILLIIGLIGATPLPCKAYHRLMRGRTATACAVIRGFALPVLLLICTAFLVDGSFNPFLYFRF